MARVLYVGDEATAAGFRLAGLDTRVAAAGEAAAALRQAFAEAPECVLLSGVLAQFVPAGELRAALTAIEPLFALVPDLQGGGTPPDLRREVRNALGIDA